MKSLISILILAALIVGCGKRTRRIRRPIPWPQLSLESAEFRPGDMVNIFAQNCVEKTKRSEFSENSECNYEYLTTLEVESPNILGIENAMEERFILKPGMIIQTVD